jgi:hypothetical protein
MGYQAECTIRYDGKTAQGKASLETAELIFRGPFRLAVPLKDITTARARDGWLSVEFGDRKAALRLDAAAAKWADRITNPPSRIQKLGIKPGMIVAALGIEDSVFLDEIRGQGATIVTGARGRAPGSSADILFYAAGQREALSKLGSLSQQIKSNGAIWVIRPKGHPAISEADVMAAGKQAGLVDVKVVSFSATHTAEKFVIPVAKRSRPSRRS